MAVRKNARNLTAAEKSKFIQAIKLIKSSGRYNQYVAWHVQVVAKHTPPTNNPTFRTRNAGHRGPAFLPWHREFVRRFELDLQQAVGDPNLGIPYWDWSQDSENPALSPIWADDFMGGNGDPDSFLVKTGPFAYHPADPNTWTIVDSQGMSRGGLTRDYDRDPRIQLPTQADVDRLLQELPYDRRDWDTWIDPSFRNRLEGYIGPGLHNQVHNWVKGSMLADSSPNDPVFFLHHCNVDRLWAKWQDRYPNAGYLPVSGNPEGHYLTAPMFPWEADGVTPASVLNHRALGYEYEGEGLQVFPWWVWRDLTEAELRGTVDTPIDLDNYREWAGTTMRWARMNGYACGVPTWEIGVNGVRGAMLFPTGLGVVWRDLTEAELRGTVDTPVDLDNYRDWAGTTMRWARMNGHVCGVPTWEIGVNGVRGTILFPIEIDAVWRDLTEAELRGTVDIPIDLDDPRNWAGTTMRWARTIGYGCGIPTWEIGVNGVRGTILFPR